MLLAIQTAGGIFIEAPQSAPSCSRQRVWNRQLPNKPSAWPFGDDGRRPAAV